MVGVPLSRNRATGEVGQRLTVGLTTIQGRWESDRRSNSAACTMSDRLTMPTILPFRVTSTRLICWVCMLSAICNDYKKRRSAFLKELIASTPNVRAQEFRRWIDKNSPYSDNDEA